MKLKPLTFILKITCLNHWTTKGWNGDNRICKNMVDTKFQCQFSMPFLNMVLNSLVIMPFGRSSLSPGSLKKIGWYLIVRAPC
jgi:hypothetical protein